MDNGQFQVYTGYGKGKTTAAIGLCVRGLGRGFKVYMGQFIKDMEYGEIAILKNLDNMTVELYGTGEGCLIRRDKNEIDTKYGKIGIEKIKKAMTEYDIVVADEINVACQLGIISEDDMLDIINSKPSNVELIFTGISAPKRVLERADLITNMKCERHYFNVKGLKARDGIER